MMIMLRKITNRDGITDEMVEGLNAGVYEIFDGEDGIDLIDTGGLSVNCRCLVIADTIERAQEMLDECDPSASGCDDDHLWLEKKENIMKIISFQNLPQGARKISMDEVGIDFSGKKTAFLFAPSGRVRSLRKLVRELEREAGDYGDHVVRRGQETRIIDIMAEAGVIFVIAEGE